MGRWKSRIDREFEGIEREEQEGMRRVCKDLGIDGELRPRYILDREVARKFAELCMRSGEFAVY